MQNHFRFFILNLWILLAASPILGQGRQMKRAAENDYFRWGTLELKTMSEKGKYISFEMRYENGMDTLFLSNTSTKKIYSFPKGKNGRFAEEKVFAFLDYKSDLQIYNLHSSKFKVFKDVASYELPLNGRFIITLSSRSSKARFLTIRSESGIKLDSIKGVTEYVLNSRGDALLYTAKSNNYYQSGIIYFDNYHRINISEKSPHRLFKPIWQKKGNNVLFLSEIDSTSKASSLKYFKTNENRLYSFDLKKKQCDADLIISSREPLVISEDGKKILFTENRNKAFISKNKDQTVEIWNGNDKILYLEKLQSENGAGIPRQVVWEPETDSYMQLNDNNHFTFGITGKKDFAVIYSKTPYGLQTKYYQEADFYLKELKSGNTIPFLKKQSIDPQQMKFDPSSNTVLYYREGNWMIYNPVNRQHINLTSKAKTYWDNDSEFSVRSQFSPYGFGGWSIDGKNILLYDQYDIWLAAADGSYCRRLTKGREKNISFRMNGSSLNKTFSISENFILQARNTEDQSSGYYILSFKSGERPLAYGSKKADQLLSGNNGIFAYTTQTFAQPPKIEIKKNNSNNTEVLYESNRHQKKYYYGKSELLFYEDQNGEKLKSALFYPAEFDPSKKYPMIVYIYEKMSARVNNYENPTLQNSIGFNITNYTLNGYFVLLPDISYKMRNPGFSALESVKTAADAAVATGWVDKRRIGLYGHSFGGYEVFFIISQTHMFAAAASGAGVSDIIAHYFSISRSGVSYSEMWRYENQQYRMGKSLFEAKEEYLFNDPILYAEKVNTPLLLWSGKEDRVVPYSQSVSYYSALRRMKKRAIMLLYKNEDHNLKKKSSQIDLSKRMMEWFDHFLKNEETAGWVFDGIRDN